MPFTTRSSRKRNTGNRESDMCELYAFPNSSKVRILGLSNYVYFLYLEVLTTDVTLRGQRQVYFLKPLLVTVTETWPTRSKCLSYGHYAMVRAKFEPGLSTFDLSAFTTRPHKTRGGGHE